MSMITGSINLAALKYVLMTKKDKNGQPLKGMFIPLEVNKLQEHESGGIYLNLVAFDMKEAKEWATHILKQSFSKEIREQIGDEKMKDLPILGNLKTSGSAPVAADNNAANGEVVDGDSEDDNLPF